MKKYAFALLGLANAIVVSQAKEFVNLNFDAGAPISELPPSFFQQADLILPGWTARMGENVLTKVIYNNVLSEHGSVGVYSAGGLWGPLPEGRYGVGLRGGAEFPSAGPAVSASISQTGMIPVYAQSLLF